MITNKRLAAGTLADSNGTLYTAPSGSGDYAIIKSLFVCNKTGSAADVTIKLDGVPLIFEKPLAANDYLVLSGLDQILEAAELIEGYSDTAAAIAFYVSGREIT